MRFTFGTAFFTLATAALVAAAPATGVRICLGTNILILMTDFVGTQSGFQPASAK
jgi:hypothetical protein